jgi:hypothetical protein
VLGSSKLILIVFKSEEDISNISELFKLFCKCSKSSLTILGGTDNSFSELEDEFSLDKD